MPAMPQQLPPFDPRFYSTGGTGPGMALQRYLEQLRANNPQPATVPPPPVVTAPGAPMLPGMTGSDAGGNDGRGPGPGTGGNAAGMLGGTGFEGPAGDVTPTIGGWASEYGIPGIGTGMVNAGLNMAGYPGLGAMLGDLSAPTPNGTPAPSAMGNPTANPVSIDRDLPAATLGFDFNTEGEPSPMGGGQIGDGIGSMEGMGGIGAEGPAGYARGGMVTRDRMRGPNPPGPDDGWIKADVGEMVVPRDKVQMLAGSPGMADMLLEALARLYGGKAPSRQVKPSPNKDGAMEGQTMGRGAGDARHMAMMDELSELLKRTRKGN